MCLPTGYGKSLCYEILPIVFDELRGVEKKSIILVVSPLSALMKDQVADASSLGIAAAYVTASSNKKDIQEGKVQVIFVSYALTSTGPIL